jgi:chromosome segregation ATPase
MNTEELKALGLNDDQIKSVMAAHGKVLNPLKEQVTSLTAERDGAQSQLTTVNGQLDQLKKDNKGNAELQAQLDTLKKANEQAKKDAAAELETVKLNSATELALTQAGAKNVKAVRALINADDLYLDDKGTVKGLSEQIKSLQEADDSKFMFNAAPVPPKTPTIVNPGNPNPDPAGEENMVSKITARLAGAK